MLVQQEVTAQTARHRRHHEQRGSTVSSTGSCTKKPQRHRPHSQDLASNAFSSARLRDSTSSSCSVSGSRACACKEGVRSHTPIVVEESARWGRNTTTIGEQCIHQCGRLRLPLPKYVTVSWHESYDPLTTQEEEDGNAVKPELALSYTDENLRPPNAPFMVHLPSPTWATIWLSSPHCGILSVLDHSVQCVDPRGQPYTLLYQRSTRTYLVHSLSMSAVNFELINT